VVAVSLKKALGPPGGQEPQEEHEHEDEPAAPYEEPAALHEIDEHQQELDLPPEAEEPPALEDPPEVHQPTVEYSVEDEHAAEAPPPAPTEEEPADELEETPEFLQETPEHDRLWFEQKPPRDFDF
jgi:hypothetical protein